ncbi:HDOD domain-containing protein [Aliikangiella sp. IMCC44359]|uniref:HDOD domain-containing protein n=1 Tax=Aliikangiella sp. IMCC44359 TaxID=3459125 RepID=UPI00403AFD9D
MADNPNNKEDWLKLLKQSSIPSFSASIKALSSAEAYTSKHSSELARTILKDPNLTASVLKLANSAHFNSTGHTIRTISRSILVLGHKSIKEVCASCLLIESFLKNGASEHLKALLSRCFHAAIQAKQIAHMHGQKNTEEIFISALLLGLGEVSVYSAVDNKHPLYRELVKSYPLKDGEERDLLGCYFNDLTLGLCQTWNIAPMIGDMIGGHYAETSPIRSILLGSSFASSCEIIGLNKAVDKHLKSISRYTGKKPDIVSEKIVFATEETQKSLQKMGLNLDIKQAKTINAGSPSETQSIKIDKILQLDIIQELSVIVQESLDINVILQQMLEGIQRGGGFNCALVALLNPERSRISAKHAIEREGSFNKENFSFSCHQDIPEIQQKVMNNKNILLQSDLREKGATTQKINRRLGVTQSLWGPLIVENKVIGCFYADNGINGPDITQEQKDAFQLFVCQTKLVLMKLK